MIGFNDALRKNNVSFIAEVCAARICTVRRTALAPMLAMLVLWGHIQAAHVVDSICPEREQECRVAYYTESCH